LYVNTSCCCRCCCCHDEPVWHCLMGGQRCPEEMRNSTRLLIRRDPSLPHDSRQPFYWLGHHSRATVVAHSWRIVDHCQTIDVDGCRQTVKLQSVLRLCSGFYRSKDPTNSIIVLKGSVYSIGNASPTEWHHNAFAGLRLRLSRHYDWPHVCGNGNCHLETSKHLESRWLLWILMSFELWWK